MKPFELSITALLELPAAAKSILAFVIENKTSEDEKTSEVREVRGFTSQKVFAFYGEMGSGKTTLIKELCRQLGSNDNFSSPTYSIVNEYLPDNGAGKIYHIDLYRLKNIEEALALGIEEYINCENYCFIEWPELIEALLPAGTIKVSIRVNNNMREISIFMG